MVEKGITLTCCNVLFIILHLFTKYNIFSNTATADCTDSTGLYMCLCAYTHVSHVIESEYKSLEQIDTCTADNNQPTSAVLKGFIGTSSHSLTPLYCCSSRGMYMLAVPASAALNIPRLYNINFTSLVGVTRLGWTHISTHSKAVASTNTSSTTLRISGHYNKAVERLMIGYVCALIKMSSKTVLNTLFKQVPHWEVVRAESFLGPFPLAVGTQLPHTVLFKHTKSK